MHKREVMEVSEGRRAEEVMKVREVRVFTFQAPHVGQAYRGSQGAGGQGCKGVLGCHGGQGAKVVSTGSFKGHEKV
jgi:hypothetical protein